VELAAHKAGVTVIVGKASTSHTKEEWIAAGIVVVLAILLIGFRRYAAARNLDSQKWTFGRALEYAFLPFLFLNKFTRQDRQSVKTRGLLVGTDGRTSTSKTTAALWTVIVVYFFVVMALVLGFDRAHFDALIGGTSPIYLVFLGGPFAAAVLAKAVVNDAQVNGTLQKSDAQTARVADVFSDDDGNTDLVDLQYIAFNLVVAGIVIAEFLHQPAAGPPPVPDILAGLTSASAATYIVNKAVITGSGNAPSINQIFPSPARPGAEVVAYGTNFTAPGSSADDRPRITVAGTFCPSLDAAPTADHATFRVPAIVPAGPAPIVLTSAAGQTTSQPTQLTIVNDSMTIAMLGRINAKPDGTVTLFGQGFYDAESIDASGVPISPNEHPADVFLTERGRPAGVGVHPCEVQPGATDTEMTVAIPDNILTGADSTIFDVSAKRGTLEASLPPDGLYVQIPRPG
jgi:hypothetical protein